MRAPGGRWVRYPSLGTITCASYLRLQADCGMARVVTGSAPLVTTRRGKGFGAGKPIPCRGQATGIAKDRVHEEHGSGVRGSSSEKTWTAFWASGPSSHGWRPRHARRGSLLRRARSQSVQVITTPLHWSAWGAARLSWSRTKHDNFASTRAPAFGCIRFQG